MIDIRGLDKADVLATLYNASKPLGMGFLSFTPEPMSREEAAEHLKVSVHFDYLHGRVMKISLDRDDEFDERLYDRDCGPGAAQRAVDSLRETGESDNPNTNKSMVEGVEKEAAKTYNRLNEETRSTGNTIKLGLSDVKDHLKPAIDKAKDSIK